MVVSVTAEGSLAFVEIDNPPVNAASQAVRAGLLSAVHSIDKEDAITAVVLHCAGRTFMAGGDIKEFDAPPVEPHLPDVLRAIELARTPWIAALHGSVLGGGLELAMACHHRLAHTDTRLGLPEVTLGLIPGAGGTVRLPRLVDTTLALTMVAGGKPITAAAALQAGLIDAVTSNDVIDEAIQRATALPAGELPRPTLERAVAPHDATAFEKARISISRKAKGQASIPAAIAAVERAITRPAQEALQAERDTFLELKASTQSAALRYIFFAERGALADSRCKTPAQDLNTIGVIGGGTMGAGISAACLLSGLTVTMVERDADAATAGKSRVHDILQQSLKRGLLSAEEHTTTLERFSTDISYGGMANADLVIEAVFEEMSVKQAVLNAVDQVTRPETILATNTSYLDVNAIAQSVTDASRVIGLHFFSPAHIMKLLEIVVADSTADSVVSSCARLSKQLGKIGVLAGVCDGFIGNRIMSAYRYEADRLLLEGALPWDIDACMRDFGFPIGVFEMQDLAGLDIAWAMRKRRAAEQPDDPDYIAIADRICEKGCFGRKTGQGWYQYGDNGEMTPSDDTVAIIESERSSAGVGIQSFTADDLLARILARMQDEARRVLAEGIASRPQDIDVVMVNGYGFPRWRGGPMFGRH